MKQKQIAIILIPAFILAVFWVLFSVYHSYVNSTITDPLSFQIIPIQGSFDKKTIEELKQRKRVETNGIIIVSDTSGDQENNASESAEIELEDNQEESSNAGNFR